MGSPISGSWWTPFVVEILFSSSSPATDYVDIVVINLLFECPVASFTALRIVTGSFFNFETWLSITWYMLQDYMWPTEQRSWAVVWKPSSKGALLATHWLTLPWQSGNLSSALRTGDEEVDHSYAQGDGVKKILPLPVEFAWNANHIRKFRTEYLPCSKMSFILLRSLAIFVTPKLGHCAKRQWNF